MKIVNKSILNVDNVNEGEYVLIHINNILTHKIILTPGIYEYDLIKYKL